MKRYKQKKTVHIQTSGLPGCPTRFREKVSYDDPYLTFKIGKSRTVTFYPCVCSLSNLKYDIEMANQLAAEEFRNVFDNEATEAWVQGVIDETIPYEGKRRGDNGPMFINMFWKQEPASQDSLDHFKREAEERTALLDRVLAEGFVVDGEGGGLSIYCHFERLDRATIDQALKWYLKKHFPELANSEFRFVWRKPTKKEKQKRRSFETSMARVIGNSPLTLE